MDRFIDTNNVSESFDGDTCNGYSPDIPTYLRSFGTRDTFIGARFHGIILDPSYFHIWSRATCT